MLPEDNERVRKALGVVVGVDEHDMPQVDLVTLGTVGVSGGVSTAARVQFQTRTDVTTVS